MHVRQSEDGRFVKNPSGCCYSWEVHYGGVVGDCYNTANVDADAQPRHVQKVLVGIEPTEDDLERWEIFLSAEKATTEAEHRKDMEEDR